MGDPGWAGVMPASCPSATIRGSAITAASSSRWTKTSAGKSSTGSACNVSVNSATGGIEIRDEADTNALLAAFAEVDQDQVGEPGAAALALLALVAGQDVEASRKI